MMESILSVLVSAVLPVLATGLAAILAVLLARLAEKVRGDGQASATRDALANIITKAGMIVQKMEQTDRAFLLEITADGKVTKEEAAALKAKALGDLMGIAAAELAQLGGDDATRAKVAEAAIESAVWKYGSASRINPLTPAMVATTRPK
ncbi:MAG: hypothetical protein ABII76_17200 [Pseudomonadota bacterium]